MTIHPKVTPIYQTSVFKFASLAELEEYYTAPGRGGRYGYSRSEHPNSEEFVAAVAALEGATGGGRGDRGGAGRAAGRRAGHLPGRRPHPVPGRAVRRLGGAALAGNEPARHRDHLRAAGRAVRPSPLAPAHHPARAGRGTEQPAADRARRSAPSPRLPGAGCFTAD